MNYTEALEYMKRLPKEAAFWDFPVLPSFFTSWETHRTG